MSHLIMFTDRISEGDNAIVSVRLSVRPFVSSPLYLWNRLSDCCLGTFACELVMTIARRGLKVKVIGQGYFLTVFDVFKTIGATSSEGLYFFLRCYCCYTHSFIHVLPTALVR